MDRTFPKTTRVASPTIPLYVPAQEAETTYTGASGPSLWVRTTTFKTAQNLATVIAYYREQLVPQGWRAVGTNLFVDSSACPMYALYVLKEADTVILKLYAEGCFGG